jgi:uncharacterized membrane protein
MAFNTTSEKDRPLEAVIGYVLRLGVLLSSLVVLTGGIVYLFRHGHESPRYQNFTGEPGTLTEFSLMWRSAWQGRGRSIIQLGLLILIATPIIRIAISVIGFLLEKDYLYLLLTLLVLGIILFNF